jgi:hypothetical protein
MQILNFSTSHIDEYKLPKLKGFLSTIYAAAGQEISILNKKFIVYHTYKVDISYYYKHKLFSLRIGEAVINKQDFTDRFFKNVGFDDSKHFLMHYGDQLKLNNSKHVYTFNLISFFKIDTFTLEFN